jgi:hypothetical protein
MVFMCSGLRTAGAFEINAPIHTTNRKHLWLSDLAKTRCQALPAWLQVLQAQAWWGRGWPCQGQCAGH